MNPQVVARWRTVLCRLFIILDKMARLVRSEVVKEVFLRLFPTLSHHATALEEATMPELTVPVSRSRTRTFAMTPAECEHPSYAAYSHGNAFGSWKDCKLCGHRQTRVEDWVCPVDRATIRQFEDAVPRPTRGRPTPRTTTQAPETRTRQATSATRPEASRTSSSSSSRRSSARPQQASVFIHTPVVSDSEAEQEVEMA